MGNKKGMTMLELQEVLGDRVRVTLRDDLSPEQRQVENEQSALIMNLGKQMINNADLILRAEKLAAQNHSLEHSIVMCLIKGEWYGIYLYR